MMFKQMIYTESHRKSVLKEIKYIFINNILHIYSPWILSKSAKTSTGRQRDFEPGHIETGIETEIKCGLADIVVLITRNKLLWWWFCSSLQSEGTLPLKQLC